MRMCIGKNEYAVIAQNKSTFATQVLRQTRVPGWIDIEHRYFVINGKTRRNVSIDACTTAACYHPGDELRR
jgi:hypothetical protein